MIDREKLYSYAKELGIELDDNMLSQFRLYASELITTNKKYNLTAITEPDDVIVKHFIDSLMLLKYFDLDYGTKIIDIGSGAGFPTLPLLIAKRGLLEATFVDSVRKKLLFIERALKVCGLKAEILHERAEELSHNKKYRESFDVATARAVAPLNVLCEYLLPFVRVGGYALCWKGPNVTEEMEDGCAAAEKLGGVLEAPVSFSWENENHLLSPIRKIEATLPQYPRKNGIPAKRPLKKDK